MQIQLLRWVRLCLEVPELAGGGLAWFTLLGEDRPKTALKQDIGLVVTRVTTPLASFTVSPTRYSLIAKMIPPSNVTKNPAPTANAIVEWEVTKGT